jgi:Uma2 family endonuclease
MADPARKRATYADLLAVPRHLVAEIIGGVLQTHPRPAPRHALASSVLGGRIGRAFHEGDGGPGGWWILDEPELHLLDGAEVVVPDLAGWRAERMSTLPETAYFTLPPDWLCEILSPSTEADDRTDKMPVYAAAGVGHAWLLDPIVRTLEIFRLESGRWVLVTTFKGDAVVRAEPFDAIELDMGALWRGPAMPR